MRSSQTACRGARRSWRASPDTGTATSGSFTLPGLQQAGTVTFEADGATHVTAGTDQDLFRMLGYTDARFRLTQMDLERRQAESTLDKENIPASMKKQVKDYFDSIKP